MRILLTTLSDTFYPKSQPTSHTISLIPPFLTQPIIHLYTQSPLFIRRPHTYPVSHTTLTQSQSHAAPMPSAPSRITYFTHGSPRPMASHYILLIHDSLTNSLSSQQAISHITLLIVTLLHNLSCTQPSSYNCLCTHLLLHTAFLTHSLSHIQYVNIRHIQLPSYTATLIHG